MPGRPECEDGHLTSVDDRMADLGWLPPERGVEGPPGTLEVFHHEGA